MKFGRVDNPEEINFTLPTDHLDTRLVLEKSKSLDDLTINIGYPKWNRADLKGFYPKGTKDDLKYYSSQFNAIEFNATFYRIFSSEQFNKWYERTSNTFRFFPKIYQDISHWKRLKNIDDVLDHFLINVSNLKEKLGTFFLQMNSNFSPKEFEILNQFIEKWPKEFSLAVEFRHSDWYNNKTVSKKLYDLLEEKNVSNIIVDTAGRRDLMHMRLTNASAFIRFVSTNHEIDYSRLDDWIIRLKKWKMSGVNEINFFIHQKFEKKSPLLASYFIKNLNIELGTNLKIPNEE